MKHRTSSEIRRMFLRYFESQRHSVLPSHSLIPPEDPTLLFVNAGMVQFKDVFVGRKTLDTSRATTSQKCLRVSGKHNDLENVGRTARHHTFFEMLGNFSFGDYFKEDAIRYGWEFLTSSEWMGLPKEKLWVTVHPEDEEAIDLWKRIAGVADDRIVKDPTNFWSMGDTGPCGPCSEIHIDQGAALSGGVEVPFGEGGDRYLELWNLVFMQYDRDAAGKLTPLPKPSIDTGMGLERIAAIVQGVTANYDTDLFRALIAVVEEQSGKRYLGRFGDPSKREAEIEEDVAFRVIADHARATAFLIADGIYPENEGRGYVLRRVMRRAIRFGRKLGIEGEFLCTVCDKVVDLMGDVYPELVEVRAIIDRAVRQEEQRFGRTLSDGLRLLEGAMAQLRAGGQQVVPGRTVFELYDTHGFPMDLTQVIAEEQGFGIDEDGFRAAMEEQRERGRASWKGADEARAALLRELADSGVRTEFVGYEWDRAEAPVVAILRDGVRVEDAGVGDRVELVAAQTPFYGESGGQVGDHGAIDGEGGFRLTVEDTQKSAEGVVLHIGRVAAGSVKVGDVVGLSVDAANRAPTRKNHSATHLLHWALRTVLGDHVKQRGSLVAPDRLRFDFSHFGPLTPEEIERVEWLVNERVVANHAVSTEVLGFQAAVARGAMAFFEEKYGDTVRVVTMAESVELCGGTHVAATGDIGLFKIVGEGGISSGVRRIEAATGMNAVRWVHERERLVQRVAEQLKTTPAQLAERVERAGREGRAKDLEIEQLKAQLATAMTKEQAGDARDFGGVKALAVPLDGTPSKDLRGLADSMRDRIQSGVVLLGSRVDGKVALLVAVTPDQVSRFDAGRMVSELAPLVGGRGGGKKDLAQAGGSDPAGLDAAIAHFYAMVESGARTQGG